MKGRYAAEGGGLPTNLDEAAPVDQLRLLRRGLARSRPISISLGELRLLLLLRGAEAAQPLLQRRDRAHVEVRAPLPGAQGSFAKPLRTAADVAALHPSELLPYWEVCVFPTQSRHTV